jgi:hypothetical protein
MARLDKYKNTTGSFLLQELWRRIATQQAYLTEGREQFVHFQLAHLYVKLGLTQYGIGRDYGEVVEALRLATASFVTVFRLKGTTVNSVVRRVASLEKAVPTKTREAFVPDFGYTNSKESIFGIAIALLSRRPDDARTIASLAGTPAHVSLANDRFLESAFKAYFTGDMEEVGRQLGCIQIEQDQWYEHMRDGFLALVSRSVGKYESAVDGMVAFHSEEALMELHQHDPLYNLCYHMMSLALMAIQDGRLSVRDVPDRPPYFPRDLIEYALMH